MASLRLRTFQIAAGQSETIAVSGDYVRVEKANVPIWIETEGGDGFQLDEGEEAQIARFERLIFRHDDAADQQIRLFIGDGARVGSAKVSGEVSVPGGVGINGLVVSVNRCTAVVRRFEIGIVHQMILGSSTLRRATKIKNISTIGTVWLVMNSWGGVVATVGNGYPLGPGEELDVGFATDGFVGAIADTLGVKIAVIEGLVS